MHSEIWQKGGACRRKKLIALFVCFAFATTVLVAGACAKKEEPAKPAAEEKKAEEAKPGESVF